jgi:hypothetical protein
MPDLFFDTSGLAKRYVAETGSSWAMLKFECGTIFD